MRAVGGDEPGLGRLRAAGGVEGAHVEGDVGLGLRALGEERAQHVLLGAQHILAEQVTDTAEIRAIVRVVLWETGKLCTAKSEAVPEGPAEFVAV